LASPWGWEEKRRNVPKEWLMEKKNETHPAPEMALPGIVKVEVFIMASFLGLRALLQSGEAWWFVSAGMEEWERKKDEEKTQCVPSKASLEPIWAQYGSGCSPGWPQTYSIFLPLQEARIIALYHHTGFQMHLSDQKPRCSKP
jgi:hypothetical protein